MSRKAVVLLSGGLDSTTVLAIASKQDKYDCFALSFNYSQRHQIELEYAAIQANLWGVQAHRIFDIDMGYISYHNNESSLVNHDIDVPIMRTATEMTDRIPSTYVPARNTIFLGYAASYAEVVGADKIYIGVNALDYSGYPDCRPEYIEAYQNMLSLATASGVEGNPIKIEAPLINLTKSEIIIKGLELGVDYDLTNSCYNPTIINDNDIISAVCGLCDSCILRAKGFMEVYNQKKIIQ